MPQTPEERAAYELTFSRFSRLNLKRCQEAFHPIDDWSLTDWATAMGGECGEALNLIKKERRGERVDLDDIGYELADLVTYADLLATAMGLNLCDLITRKFNRVSERVGSNVVIKELTDQETDYYRCRLLDHNGTQVDTRTGSYRALMVWSEECIRSTANTAARCDISPEQFT